MAVGGLMKVGTCFPSTVGYQTVARNRVTRGYQQMGGKKNAEKRILETY